MTRLAPILAVAAVFACSFAGPAAKAVVGGTTVQVQSAPWAVFIRQVSAFGVGLCGGSIVDSLHVLTAAHCVRGANGAGYAAPSSVHALFHTDGNWAGTTPRTPWGDCTTN